MPRRPRTVVPGLPMHVIVRGVNREPIFYDDQDYRYYLGRLKEALEKHQCGLHAYVLMTNHVHLLLTPAGEAGVGKALQMLGRYYVQYFNHTYGRTGTLWEGRYKSSLVDTDSYLLTCYRYIELNPVRAMMVEHSAEYPWSSYRYNGLGQANPIITPHARYLGLADSEASRLKAYRDLFSAHIPEKQLSEIRQAANREWVLGSEYFKDRIARQLQRRVAPLTRGGDRRSGAFRFNRH